MGWTASGGVEGLGQFTSTPTTKADFNKLLQFLSDRGNLSKGPTEVREAVSGAALYSGRFWWDTTLRTLFVVISGAWVALRGPDESTPGLVYASTGPEVGRYGNDPAMSIWRRDGYVTANLAISKAYAFGDGDVPGTFPLGFRPAKYTSGSGVFADTGQPPVWGGYSISTAGVVTLSGAPGGRTKFFAPVVFRVA